MNVARVLRKAVLALLIIIWCFFTHVSSTRVDLKRRDHRQLIGFPPCLSLPWPPPLLLLKSNLLLWRLGRGWCLLIDGMLNSYTEEHYPFRQNVSAFYDKI